MTLFQRVRELIEEHRPDRPNTDDVQSPALQQMRENLAETRAIRKEFRESGNWIQDMVTGRYRPRERDELR